MTIAAIETRYAGCLFRSRLEARWAVFLDRLSIAWEYEPEGFETASGWYLPDFRIRIPQVKNSLAHVQWLEIKPAGAPDDPRHIALATGTGMPVIVARDLPRSYHHQLRGHQSPLIVLGVECGPWPVAFHGGDFTTDDDFYCGLGDNRHWCQEHFAISLRQPHLALYGRHVDVATGSTTPPSWSFTTHPPFDSPRVDAAYAAARSARFEYGEIG